MYVSGRFEYGVRRTDGAGRKITCDTGQDGATEMGFHLSAGCWRIDRKHLRSKCGPE